MHRIQKDRTSIKKILGLNPYILYYVTANDVDGKDGMDY